MMPTNQPAVYVPGNHYCREQSVYGILNNEVNLLVGVICVIHTTQHALRGKGMHEQGLLFLHHKI